MLLRKVVIETRWLRRAGVLSVLALASAPLVAAASPRDDRPSATISAAAAGVVYGGVTPQNFGVMVEVNKSGRQIVRVATGIGLTCSSGQMLNVPDGWSRVSVSKKGKFSVAYGPEIDRDEDGSSVEAEGTLAGRFNTSRTSVSGTWTMKLTFRDAAGVVTDTCDAGSVKWSAKQ
jgi:hypothetical protein